MQWAKGIKFEKLSAKQESLTILRKKKTRTTSQNNKIKLKTQSWSCSVRYIKCNDHSGIKEQNVESTQTEIPIVVSQCIKQHVFMLLAHLNT